jgi:hypothetical protein
MNKLALYPAIRLVEADVRNGALLAVLVRVGGTKRCQKGVRDPVAIRATTWGVCYHW